MTKYYTYIILKKNPFPKSHVKMRTDTWGWILDTSGFMLVDTKKEKTSGMRKEAMASTSAGFSQEGLCVDLCFVKYHILRNY
jgi:hypothetical protein